MLFTWPIYAALGIAIAIRFARSSVAYAAHTLGAGAALALGAHVDEPRASLMALFFYALAALTAARTFRNANIARPALFAAVMTLLLAFLVGASSQPSWAPLVAALGLLYVAFHTRTFTLALVAGVALVVGAALAATGIEHHAWPPVLIAVSWGLLLPSSRGSGPVLAGLRQASVLAVVLGVASCAGRALPGASQAAVWGFLASAGASSYALCALHVCRHQDRTRAANLLLAIGALTGLTIAFAIEMLTTTPTSTRLWLHAIAVAVQSIAWSRLSAYATDAAVARCARWLAAPSALLPTLACVVPAAAALLFCPSPGQTASFGNPLLASACGLIAIAAIGAAQALGTARRHVRIGLFCALLVLGWIAVEPPAGPGGHLVVPLVGAGLALGAAALRGQLGLVWPLSALMLALFASHAHIGGPGPLTVSTAFTLVLGAAWLRTRPRHASRLAAATALGLLVSLGLAVLWAAAELSTGRHAATAVLAPLGAALLAGSIAITTIGRRPIAGAAEAAVIGRGGIALATLTALLALVASTPPALPDVLGVGFVTLALGIAALCVGGMRDGQTWMLDVAAFALPTLYALARRHGLPGEAAADAVIAIGAAHALFWVAVRAASRSSFVTHAYRHAALAWPLASVFLMLTLSADVAAPIALLAAVHYSAISRVRGEKWLTVPASMFANAGMFCSLHALRVSDVLAWILPVGVTLLLLVHVYAEELGSRSRRLLRLALVAGLYAVAIASTFGASPLRSLVLVPALCVLAMLAGVVLRVRIYLIAGMAFLAADLALEMLRHGLQSRPLAAIFLTALGLLLVAMMVAFSVERERILRRYSTALGELRTWD